MNEATALVKKSFREGAIALPSKEMQEAIVKMLQAVEAEADRRTDELQNEDMTGVQKQALRQEVLLGVLRDFEYIIKDRRADIIVELDKGDLWSQHPSSPKKASELMRDHDISEGEAWDLITWRTLIFPWIEKELGMKRYEVSMRLGASKMRRITPTLRAILDPEHARKSEKTEQAIESIEAAVKQEIAWSEAMQSVAAVESGEGDEFDEQVVSELETFGQVTPETADTLVSEYQQEHPGFDWDTARAGALLAMAEQRTNRDLDEGLSPERTPAINAAVIEHEIETITEDGEVVQDGSVFKLSASMTHDQYNLLQRRFKDGRMVIVYQKGKPIQSQ